MDRLACVNVAAFPLQLLLCARPEWAALPVAVVEDDRPQAPVLVLNAQARRLGVRVGHRYATALSLARDLRAGTVPQSQIEHSVRALADRLRRYSPHVEPSPDTPGVFWLDAEGLGRLHQSLHTWADKVRADLQRAGMKATMAVGFSRFGAYALAMSHRGTVVCADAAEEQDRVQRVPLFRLNLDLDTCDRLLALGIDTVGGFLGLPGDGIRMRFGAGIDSLYQLAAGYRWAPLVPVPAEERHEDTVHFDAPETHVERLLFVVKRQLDGFVTTVAYRAETIVEVILSMKLDDRTMRVERVKPAAATLDVTQLLTLVRLRLDALQLPAGIVTLRVTAGTCPATSDQRRLFPEQTRRDTEAANQALAKLRAECGGPRVVRARINNAHLPVARFAWEPLERLAVRSAPRVVASRPLVRRIYMRSVPLPPGFSLEDSIGAGDGKLVGQFQLEPVPAACSPPPAAVLSGPYVVSGGWWGGGERRDYYFVHTKTGDLWWLYFDHRRQRFFLQGRVE